MFDVPCTASSRNPVVLSRKLFVAEMTIAGGAMVNRVDLLCGESHTWLALGRAEFQCSRSLTPLSCPGAIVSLLTIVP